MTYGEIQTAVLEELQARAALTPDGDFDLSKCLTRLREAEECCVSLLAQSEKLLLRDHILDTLSDCIQCTLHVGFVRTDQRAAAKLETVEQVFDELRWGVKDLSNRIRRTPSVYWLNTGGRHLFPAEPDFCLLLFAKNVRTAIDSWTRPDHDYSGFIALQAIQAAACVLTTCLLMCY